MLGLFKIRTKTSHMPLYVLFDPAYGIKFSMFRSITQFCGRDHIVMFTSTSFWLVLNCPTNYPSFGTESPHCDALSDPQLVTLNILDPILSR